MARFSFFGEGLPDIDLDELKGKLIVLEGTDGVGRSTHIGLLKEWLENHGHAVLDTGMTRSALAGKRLKQAKEGHTLGGITMSLFYATDFADQLENIIIPALRADFIVLADRYGLYRPALRARHNLSATLELDDPLAADAMVGEDDPAFGVFASVARYPATVFDLRPIRRALHQIALDKLSPRESGLLYWADAYDAIVCYREVTPAGH